MKPVRVLLKSYFGLAIPPPIPPDGIILGFSVITSFWGAEPADYNFSSSFPFMLAFPVLLRDPDAALVEAVFNPIDPLFASCPVFPAPAFYLHFSRVALTELYSAGFKSIKLLANA